MDLSDKIKAIREAKNIKQIDVAKALDLDPAYYFRLEKRGNKLTVEQLENIAGALGVSVVELLTGEPQKVVYSEEVESLRKRVEELESWLGDKEKVNKEMERQVDIFKYSLNDWFYRDCFLSTAFEYSIGTIKIIDPKNSKTIKSVSLNDFQTGLAIADIQDIDWVIKYEFAHEEKQQIFEKIYRKETSIRLMDICFKNQILDTEEFAWAYEAFNTREKNKTLEEKIATAKKMIKIALAKL